MAANSLHSCHCHSLPLHITARDGVLRAVPTRLPIRLRTDPAHADLLRTERVHADLLHLPLAQPPLALPLPLACPAAGLLHVRPGRRPSPAHVRLPGQLRHGYRVLQQLGPRKRRVLCHAVEHPQPPQPLDVGAPPLALDLAPPQQPARGRPPRLAWALAFTQLGPPRTRAYAHAQLASPPFLVRAERRRPCPPLPRHGALAPRAVHRRAHRPHRRLERPAHLPSVSTPSAAQPAQDAMLRFVWTCSSRIHASSPSSSSSSSMLCLRIILFLLD